MGLLHGAACVSTQLSSLYLDSPTSRHAQLRGRDERASLLAASRPYATQTAITISNPMLLLEDKESSDSLAG
jgi:hypothetical protein